MRKRVLAASVALSISAGCAAPRMVEYERTTHYDRQGVVSGYSETERVTGADRVYIKSHSLGGPAPTMFLWCEDEFALECREPAKWRATSGRADAIPVRRK